MKSPVSMSQNSGSTRRSVGSRTRWPAPPSFSQKTLQLEVTTVPVAIRIAPGPPWPPAITQFWMIDGPRLKRAIDPGERVLICEFP